MINFIMGCACAGKSTLLEAVAEERDVGLIQVGKIFRERYSPDHFKGQAAPKHTQHEAWDIFLEELEKCAEKDTILVDGQPRSLDQVDKCLQYPTSQFIYLDCSLNIRRERLKHRFPPGPSFDLANARMTNDIETYEQVLSLLDNVITIDSSGPIESYLAEILRII